LNLLVFRFLLAILGIVVIGPSAIASAASPGIEALQHFYASVHDLETHFEQVQSDEKGQVMQKSSGRFALLRPARFRWEYTTPYRQTMVSDGLTFWLYDVDLAQVTKRTVAEALQGTPALLLSGGPALQQQFNMEDQGSGGELQWVKLTPKAGNSDFSSIRLGLRNGQPRRMELYDKLGQQTRIDFSDLRINPGLKPASFDFQIPAGVEVVEEKSPPRGAKP
jgi:outer membrane lipoprotein carrier protein